MNTSDQENLVVVREQRDIREMKFPISIDPVGVPRTPSHEANFRHVTSLVVPILKLEENKILTVNKLERNSLKYPREKFPRLCLDTIGGGHFRIGLIPEEERKAGILTLATARLQAYQELCEELIPNPLHDNAPSFIPQDLVFLGFYPYADNKNVELSLAFGLVVNFWSGSYSACDDLMVDGKKRDVSLPLQAYYYDELKEMWRTRDKHQNEYCFENGLGRLLEKGNLDQVIKETELPARVYQSFDINGHNCNNFAGPDCYCGLCGKPAHTLEYRYGVSPENAEYMWDPVDQSYCKYCGKIFAEVNSD